MAVFLHPAEKMVNLGVEPSQGQGHLRVKRLKQFFYSDVQLLGLHVPLKNPASHCVPRYIVLLIITCLVYTM